MLHAVMAPAMVLNLHNASGKRFAATCANPRRTIQRRRGLPPDDPQRLRSTQVRRDAIASRTLPLLAGVTTLVDPRRDRHLTAANLFQDPASALCSARADLRVQSSPAVRGDHIESGPVAAPNDRLIAFSVSSAISGN